jgi:hypothetical protein
MVMSQLTKPAFTNVTNFPFGNQEANAVLAMGAVTVPDNTLTTVATLAANGVRFITKVIGSGQDTAIWEVYLNSTLQIRKRASDYTCEFDFKTPLRVDASTVLDVKVKQTAGSPVDFDASIIGFERGY